MFAMDSLFCQFIVNCWIPVFEVFSERVLLHPVFEVCDGSEPVRRLLLLWQLRYEVPAAHDRGLRYVFQHTLLSLRGAVLQPAAALSPGEPVF